MGAAAAAARQGRGAGRAEQLQTVHFLVIGSFESKHDERPGGTSFFFFFLMWAITLFALCICIDMNET